MWTNTPLCQLQDMVSSLTQENFLHLKENVCDINAIAAQMSYVRCKQVIWSKQGQDFEQQKLT